MERRPNYSYWYGFWIRHSGNLFPAGDMPVYTWNRKIGKGELKKEKTVI